MIDGVLYTTVGVTRNVVAIDPKTGETLWVWRANDGEQRFAAAPRKTSGRGLSYWKDGAGNQRLFVVTPGFYLRLTRSRHGPADAGLRRERCGRPDGRRARRGDGQDEHRQQLSALVIGDVIVVGPAHEVGMRPPSKTNLKCDVRGYDVRTGKLLWTFHTIPAAGEPGYETWLNGRQTRGNAGVWGRISGDAELGSLSARRSAVGRYLRRRAPGLQSLRQQPRVPRREDGRRSGTTS